jgi:2-oxoglutarate ferredoxin oxidoreductase subunit beta
LLFNNRIYGLTKCQYSPTSEMGKKTKSSPFGSVEKPINPLSVAIASRASFIARAVDTDAPNLRDILLQAARHRGSVFVEILQNCNVFNDNAFASFTDKSVKEDRLIYLKHNEPIVFGKDKEKGISMRRASSGVFQPEIVNVKDVDASEILIHDENSQDTALAYLLAQLDETEFPVPLGVFRKTSQPLYGELLENQVQDAKTKLGKGDFFKHLRSGDIWSV